MTSIEDSIIDINKKKRKEIEIGLDFILSHLEQPVIFPRTIMTKKLGYQKIVYSKENALEHFLESDFVDCRINAFPSLQEGATWIPQLLFIDLDLSDFKKSLKVTLNKILKNIKEKLDDDNAHPTVLWSGNGYHIILPVYCPIELERIRQFQGFNISKLSQEFLRFSKDYLSNGKGDKSNYPSFRSCLLRIPNSYNGKCLARGGEEESLENSIVKIIQEWHGYRPPIQELLYDFRSYLIQKKIDEYNYKQTVTLIDTNKKGNKKYRYYYPNYNYNNYYVWIDRILQTPFEDGRKIISSLILAPYLINVKNLSFQECFQIIKEWLDKCNSLEKLYDSRSFNSRISYSLKNSKNKQIGPMSHYNIQTESNYSNLYILLKKKGIFK